MYFWNDIDHPHKGIYLKINSHTKNGKDIKIRYFCSLKRFKVILHEEVLTLGGILFSIRLVCIDIPPRIN
jgi:hypothetical protein